MDPVLPLSLGRAERHGFEYHRHGTLSLYAALNTQTGEVLGRTASRHTSEEFVTFLQLQVNIFNATNINDVTAVTQQSGSSFGLATANMLPRIVAFSAHYIF